MMASELAKKVVEFIKHNNIDITKYSMDEIVESYFEAQLKAIDIAAKKVLETI